MNSAKAALLLASFVIALKAGSCQNSAFSISSPWAWVCRDSRCLKEERSLLADNETAYSLAGCKLMCGESSVLWPKPRGSVYLSRKLASFARDQLKFVKMSAPSKETEDLLKEASEIFGSCIDLLADSSAGSPPDHQVHIQMSISSDQAAPKWQGDESYTLSIQTHNAVTWVHIVAGNFFGARHGLETLSQLIAWDDLIGHYLIMTDATIGDSPAFPHRGLLIDTSRNYVNVATIKRIIDAMAYDKLNVLHWHLTDTHSFPFISQREPLLAIYGAYSPSQVYRPEDIRVIVHYAKVRGVLVLPEFDAPAHVGSGWQWGEKYGFGKMVLCFNKEPWQDYCVEPPCGQLNPINDHIYRVLGNIYKDMAELFQNDVFHMGGDEVHMRCWNETSEILDWLTERGLGNDNEAFLHLWSHFQNRSLDQVDQAFSGVQQPVVMWTSALTEEGRATRYLDPKRYVIQIWTNATDHQIADLYRQGYKLIMSNYDAWYFDCGYGAWVGDGANNWCSPYIGWQKAYTNSPRRLITDFNLPFDSRRVLGGEAAIWSEQVDSVTIQGKLWPRASAMAERLWTDPDSSWREAEVRMYHHRQRMVRRGIMADALQPEWCHQNEGYCVL